MQHYLSLGLRAVFVENVALAFFLGLCSFLASSRRLSNALGLGLAVVFVLGVTCPLNHLIFVYVLSPGALAGLHPALAEVDLSFLSYLAFIGTIAAAVQLVEMVIERYSPRLYQALGVFVPLTAVNCAILGGSLLATERRYDFAESAVFGVGSGVGWALAIVALAAVRERLRYSNVPPALRGLGVTFMVTGLMAMAFMLFSGV